MTPHDPDAPEHDGLSRAEGLHVRDVMSRKVSTLRASEELALEALLQKFRDVRHLPVVCANGRLIGMLTRMDVLEEGLRTHRESWVRVRDLMTCPVESIHESDSLPAAARAMRRARLHALVVLDASGRMVGILTDGDLLSVLAGEHPPSPEAREGGESLPSH